MGISTSCYGEVWYICCQQAERARKTSGWRQRPEDEEWEGDCWCTPWSPKAWASVEGEETSANARDSELAFPLPFCHTWIFNRVNDVTSHWWGQIFFTQFTSVHANLLQDTSINTPRNNVSPAVLDIP